MLTPSRAVFRAAALATALLAVTAQAPASVPPQPQAAPVARPASLVGIQDRIDRASWNAYRGDLGSYAGLIRELAAADGSTATAAYLKAYWNGYLHYQYALSLMRGGKGPAAADALATAISSLRGIANKDVEVHALLGLAAGLNLQYVPRQMIMIAVQDVNGELAAALTGRPTLRSYYASAVSDFNTPVIYGGGKRADDLVTKALAQPDEGPARLRPTWGRDSVTALRIRILLARKATAQAAMMYKQAQARYPTSTAIAELAKQF